MNGAYYNEIDPFAAAWLRELIRRDLICVGEVDERSIEVVQPDDLRGFTQCHFFAGAGVWSYALRRAGWDDTRPVWTGSCPCQPFSSAGEEGGFDDPRHLWPHFYRLIRECRPDVCFGEQVAAKAALPWLDLVSADLEREGYAVGTVDTCAAGVGAPHRRQRLYWVADAPDERRERWRASIARDENGSCQPERQGEAGLLGYAGYARLQRHGRPLVKHDAAGREVEERHDTASGVPSLLAVTDGGRCEVPDVSVRPARQEQAASLDGGSGFWSAADWIPCADGKLRPIEPGTSPLVTGAPARVGRLRGYGNAINAEQAIAFIEAYLDVEGGCVA